MTAKSLTFPKATALSIGELGQPIVSTYQVGLIVYRLYRQKRFNHQSLNLKKEKPNRRDFALVIQSLFESGVIAPIKGLISKSTYEVLGKSGASAQEIICAADPFCYLSHLSAMDFHGLTDRLPRTVFISSPSPKDWKESASQRMQRDLADDLPAYLDSGLPKLARVKFGKIQGRAVTCHYTIHHGAFRMVKERALRVATIGRTFLDMLRQPEYCGGMHHVVDVYRRHARQYLRLIVDEIDRHGMPIDKVRAGYILTESCGLSDHVIDAWAALAQRGGSRKLDHAGEYSSVFSERWCLSINVPEASADGE